MSAADNLVSAADTSGCPADSESVCGGQLSAAPWELPVSDLNLSNKYAVAISRNKKRTYADTQFSGKLRYNCLYCDRQYSSKGGLNTHIRVVHKKSCLYSCPKCYRTFSRKHHLTNHLESSEKKGKCPIYTKWTDDITISSIFGPLNQNDPE